jgi:hypothetical protein
MDAALDYPMSFFEEDEETGEMVEVTTTVGDALASNADGISGVIGNAVGGVNPLLGLLAAGGAGALLSGARRKKKAAVEADEAEPAKGKSKKA